MTRDQAIQKLSQAYQAKLTDLHMPGLRDQTAQLLAEESLWALSECIQLDPQSAEASAKLHGVGAFKV